LKRIYVAEDQRELADMLRVVLGGDRRFRVRIFGNGLDAYRATREQPPDLLVIDILLPYLNGLAVTRLLKFHEDFKGFPVLVMSSATDPDIEERARKAGADAFIAKPFEVPRLLQVIEGLLQAYQ
jgi:two-component system, cell cycle response regulator DivK